MRVKFNFDIKTITKYFKQTLKEVKEDNVSTEDYAKVSTEDYAIVST